MLSIRLCRAIICLNGLSQFCKRLKGVCGGQLWGACPPQDKAEEYLDTKPFSFYDRTGTNHNFFRFSSVALATDAIKAKGVQGLPAVRVYLLCHFTSHFLLAIAKHLCYYIAIVLGDECITFL